MRKGGKGRKEEGGERKRRKEEGKGDMLHGS